MHDTFEATRIGRWVMPLDTLICTYDEALLALIGSDPNRRSFHIFEYFEMVHEADQPALHRELQEVRETLRPFDVTFRLIRPADKATIWINARGSVAPDEHGNATVYGINYDVTGYKEREEMSWLVAGEMGHRVKNLLTVVNAIFRISAASSESVPALRESFTGRLEALRILNDLLLANEESISADRLVQDIIAPLVCDTRMQISVEPGMEMSGGFAQMFALSMNELMTNATKHGALKDPEGKVNLSLTSAPGDQVVLKWVETMANPPSHAQGSGGFGMKVLRDMAGASMGGTPELEWSPEGLRYTCTWPRNRLLGH